MDGPSKKRRIRVLSGSQIVKSDERVEFDRKVIALEQSLKERGLAESDARFDTAFDYGFEAMMQYQECNPNQKLTVEQWKELFLALMLSMDSKWETILEEFMGIKALKVADIDKILTEKLRVKQGIQPKMKKLLYVNLLSYVKGDALSRVQSNGSDLAFE